MRISGFTFIRNAKKYDYPILECIESMLPLVDELVINVGTSEDETEHLVRSINSTKITIIPTTWDDSKTEKGLILSEQTNIALKGCSGDWGLYLQADEAIHEDEYVKIRTALSEGLKDESLDGFRFRYLHFYGGYTAIQREWNWYPSEVRVIRLGRDIQSYGDAQGFRGANERKLNTKLLDAHVFHYGHARNPDVMKKKIHYFHRFWHGDSHKIKVSTAYKIDPKKLVWYWDSHPKSYMNRVEQGKDWSIRPELFQKKTLKNILIFSTGAHWDLAVTLNNLLKQPSKTSRIELCDNMFSWCKVIPKYFFKRQSSAIVDLEAEDRSFVAFLFWMLDAFLAFRWRIAHAPTGKLSRWRRLFYSAIHWGCHENSNEGFHVPEKKYAYQISLWLNKME